MLKIDDLNPGDKVIFSKGFSDEHGNPVEVVIEILETGWYESPVKPAVFVRGAKVRFKTGEEDIMYFIPLLFGKVMKEGSIK